MADETTVTEVDVDETVEEPTEETQDGTEEQNEEQDEQQAQPTSEDVAALKESLTKVRKLQRDAEKRAKAAETALAAKDKPAEEQELDRVRREAAEETTKTFNQRIVKLSMAAAAKGRLANPDDAARFIDLDQFDLEDGEVDADALDSALSDLLAERPYLAAESKKRFQGGGHQGAKAPAHAAQLTQADLKNMTPAEINTARKAGRLDRILGKS